jgi:hypothetical protein
VAVRRYFLLVLLAVLPLQATWAAVAFCPRGEHQSDRASAPDNTSHTDFGHRHEATTHTHDGHPHGDHGTAGHSGCSLVQFVAIGPFDITLQLVPRPSVALMGIVQPRYESHVPDGLDRPNWRFAA